MLASSYSTERAALVAELASLLDEHQLIASWHVDGFDDLLRLLPGPGTDGAGFCLRFETGFWAAYAQADLLDQARVRAGTRVQVGVRYDPQARDSMQCLIRTAKTVHPD